MKPSLIKEKNILMDLNFKKNHFYLGVISRVLHGKLIVKFFNGVIGILPKRFTNHLDGGSLKTYFAEGHLVSFPKKISKILP